MDYSLPGSSVHGNSLDKNARVGCHFFLQGLFLTQRLKPHLLCLLLWQAGSLPLAPLGKPLSYILNIQKGTHLCLTPSLTLLAQVIHRKGWSCFPQNSICACPGLWKAVDVQLLNCIKVFAIPWTSAHHVSVPFTLLEFAQTHVHWVSDAFQPPQSSVAPSLLTLNLS